ncbi:hypothetical protein IBTHAUMO2_640002 [Nitrosopumilaceae archaeon]|nr:hypothetical protein IBTHAUMO2_640002 [Nitrosopumilaceae archaeon]
MILVVTGNTTSTLMEPSSHPMYPKTMNCLLSRKNFQSLSGLDMVDYSPFIPRMLTDVQIGRRYTFPLYCLGLKKITVFDGNGDHTYVLLKRRDR